MPEIFAVAAYSTRVGDAEGYDNENITQRRAWGTPRGFWYGTPEDGQSLEAAHEVYMQYLRYWSNSAVSIYSFFMPDDVFDARHDDEDVYHEYDEGDDEWDEDGGYEYQPNRYTTFLQEISERQFYKLGVSAVRQTQQARDVVAYLQGRGIQRA